MLLRQMPQSDSVEHSLTFGFSGTSAIVRMITLSPLSKYQLYCSQSTVSYSWQLLGLPQEVGSVTPGLGDSGLCVLFSAEACKTFA